MPSQKVTILNELGLHARAANRLVECANHFSADVRISNSERHVDGKSIMGLLMLAAGPGMEVEIKTTGPDSENALLALVDLISSGFGEPEL